MKNKNKNKINIVFFTGAGISAESGISTFRDSNGLWDNHKIEEICNINSWRSNKENVFKFYNERRSQLSEVEPNLIHKKLAEFQNTFESVANITIITQNIDNLLERAGCKNIIHVHGKLTEMVCMDCDHTWDVGYESQDFLSCDCPKCEFSDDVKPSVVFFGEHAPNYHIMKKTFRTVNDKDFLIVIGTMGNVVNINSVASITTGTRILNNLEENPYINAKNFEYSLYGPGTSKILEIEEILKRLLLS